MCNTILGVVPGSTTVFVCICVCSYSSDRIQRVLYGQQEDFVATVRVVSVGWSGDSL